MQTSFRREETCIINHDVRQIASDPPDIPRHSPIKALKPH